MILPLYQLGVLVESTAAKEWLLEYQSRKPYAYQDEIAIALEEERDITVS